MSENLDDAPRSGSDHDLLIDMRRIQLELRADVRTMRDQYGALFLDLGTRLAALEKHDGDSSGRFVTTESAKAVAWDQMASEWQWFRGMGKYIWGIAIAIISAVAAAMTSAVMHGVVLGGR